jgi:hypothetical protein
LGQQVWPLVARLTLLSGQKNRRPKIGRLIPEAPPLSVADKNRKRREASEAKAAYFFFLAAAFFGAAFFAGFDAFFAICFFGFAAVVCTNGTIVTVDTLVLSAHCGCL